jgi:pimeloyl-ACP methyl ester carboxylesterase
MKLHVEVEPEGRGPHLLLVHGFLSSRAQWRPNLAALKQHVRPVIVELWGHGRSPAPEDPAAYRVTSYIDAFEAIRRDLGVDRWLVCGQSFGAGLTIRYAHSHPAQVIGQIFTNSVSALSAPGEREGGADKMMARADAREMLEDAALIQPAGIANAIRYTTPQLSVLDCLSELMAPGLLVNGLWERPFQPLRDRAAKLLPSLAIEDLEGGHSINVEAPTLFNDAVARFAAKLTQAA